jgi:hypothetical protein
MRITRACLLTLVALLSCMTVFGQAGEQSGMIKTATGILIVWNEPGNYYTVEVRGEKIEPVPEHNLWFKVDGKFFQIVTLEKKQFVKGSAADNKAILAAHREWETDYLSKTLGAKLQVESNWIKLANGEEAHSWSYEMPKVSDKQTAIKQLYLAIVKRDHVMLMNRVVEAGDDEKVAARFLLETMSAVKPSERPLSLKQAQENVLKAQ